MVLFLLLIFVLSLTYIFWEAQPFFVLFLFSSICFLSYNMYARRACRIKSDIGTALLTTLPTFLHFFLIITFTFLLYYLTPLFSTAVPIPGQIYNWEGFTLNHVLDKPCVRSSH